ADTTDADYDFQANLLMKAYFLALRASSQVMIRQGTGGALIVVASKNGVAVGGNAAVYSAAKAFELHLMRCTASDLAKHEIRCNAINPDAVLQGSGIWSDAWKEQTAKTLGIGIDELPEYYRKRSMLGRAVSPEDCAEAIAWLASEKRSSRTTGCVIPVDGGVREGFLR
ncbi:MAG TPA: SDR family oxidoreductase, partial [Fimbriimonadaceae bacterium]|nr:SDR family oxidoreductase [Fimbriimonadaceae bacterium]